MRVLVTGAASYLGQSLVRYLLTGGHDVSVLTRRPFHAAELFGEAVAIHEWHPLSEDVPADAVAGVSAVAHLTGGPVFGPSTPERRERIKASREVATEKLVEAFEGRRIRLVVASLPRLRRNVPSGSDAGEEDSPRAQSATPFETSALEHERAALRAAKVGNSVAVVRLGLLLGVPGHLSILQALARRRLRADLRGAAIPVIDVDDAVALFAGLLERTDFEGFVNGVAPEPLRGEDLADAIAETCGRRPFFALPEFVLFRYAGELTPFLLNRARISPDRLNRAGASFAHPDPKASLLRTLEPSTERKRRLWRRMKRRASLAADPVAPVG